MGSCAEVKVAAESSIRKPVDLIGREVGVGYHSGSHFSAKQAPKAFLRWLWISISNNPSCSLSWSVCMSARCADFWVKPAEKMVRLWCCAFADHIDFAIDYQPGVVANFSGICALTRCRSRR
jgi:hypothetical protein